MLRLKYTIKRRNFVIYRVKDSTSHLKINLEKLELVGHKGGQK